MLLHYYSTRVGAISSATVLVWESLFSQQPTQLQAQLSRSIPMPERKRNETEIGAFAVQRKKKVTVTTCTRTRISNWIVNPGQLGRASTEQGSIVFRKAHLVTRLSRHTFHRCHQEMLFGYHLTPAHGVESFNNCSLEPTTMPVQVWDQILDFTMFQVPPIACHASLENNDISIGQ